MKTMKQTAKLSGSFFNYLMGNNSSIPVVGKGATRLGYSDRYPYEVIEVSEDGKTVKIESLNAKHDKTKEGGMGHQNWVFEPTGQFTTLIYRKGAWRSISKRVEFVDGFYEKELDGLSMHSPEYKRIAELLGFGQDKMNVVEGMTRVKTSYDKVSIIFGVRENYYDWSF